MQITVGQALLLLIDAHEHSIEIRHSLEDLYLNGVPPSKQEALQSFLQNSILKDYEIVKTPDAINQDPTRRYFETHLCFETLRGLLAKIDIERLKAVNAYYFSELKQRLKPADMYRVKCVLDVKSPSETKISNLEKEISDALCRLESRKNAPKESDSLSLSDIDKMQFFLHAAFLGIVLGNTLTQSPLQQQALVMYRPNHKGRILKAENNTTSTLNYGILKGHMPLPLDDKARAVEPFLYLKPSEQSQFDEQAVWPQKNFNLLVLPFSNGISSTIINQLKVMLQGMQRAPQAFTWLRNDMRSFFSGFIATMLFQSGGHTLYEYVAPFSLPEVIEIYNRELQLDTSKLSLNALFKDDNMQALANAFTKTLKYNHILLNKAKVNHEILTAFPMLRKVEKLSQVPVEIKSFEMNDNTLKVKKTK